MSSDGKPHVVRIEPAVEVDVAPPIQASKSRRIGPAIENDYAPPITPLKTVSATFSAPWESLHGVSTATGIRRALGSASTTVGVSSSARGRRGSSQPALSDRDIAETGWLAVAFFGGFDLGTHFADKWVGLVCGTAAVVVANRQLRRRR